MTRRVARAAPVNPPASDGHKETSPELAELAGLYTGMSDVKMTSLINKDRHAFCVDVRRLAASVLAQVEPKP